MHVLNVGQITGKGIQDLPKPPGTVGYGMDYFGRSFWHVILDDGTEDKILFDTPDEFQVNTLTYLKTVSGEIPDRDALEVITDYLRIMEDIIDDAEAQFTRK